MRNVQAVLTTVLFTYLYQRCNRSNKLRHCGFSRPDLRSASALPTWAAAACSLCRNGTCICFGGCVWIIKAQM